MAAAIGLAAVLLSASARAEPGTRLWAFGSEGAVLSSPALGSGGDVYFGSYDSYLYAVAPEAGTLSWRFSVKPAKATQTAYIYSSPALGADGTIYFGTEEHNLTTGQSSGSFYAVAADGTLRWKYALDGAVYSDPAVGSDGTVYFACYEENHLYALNPNGTLKWKFTTSEGIFSDPVIGTDGTIYFGCDDHHLYALAKDGTQRWAFDTGGPVTASPAIGADGTIYIGTTSAKTLYAIDPNGAERWRFTTAGRVNSSAAITPDGSIVFGSDDGACYALRADGGLRWRFAAPGKVRSSPAVAADGTIYFGSDDGHIYAVDGDGILRWRYATGDYVFASPLIGMDGTIMVGSADRQLHAVRGTSAAAASAWPMFRHDHRHSGARPSTPAPPVAAPRIQAVSLTGGLVRFSWDSVPGTAYKVQHTSELIAGPWIDLAPAGVADSATMAIEDTTAASAVQRFYRIMIGAGEASTIAANGLRSTPKQTDSSIDPYSRPSLGTAR
jgi:outer membrane protein assembly factor BamB